MNYAELKTAIQNYLQNTETTFVSTLDTIIQQAEDRINNTVQLPDFRRNVAGSMTADNQYLAIPTDFLSPYSLSYTTGTGTAAVQTFLINKDVNWIRETYPNATATGTGSTPKYYAQFSDEHFLLAPTPGGSYVTELHYFYGPASITSGATGGSTWLSTNAESALLYGCLIEGYTFMKGEADMFQIYQRRYEEALARLKVIGDGKDRKDTYRSGQLRIPVT